MTATLTAPETIECPVCEQQVGPTREGGTRPRPHNDLDGRPCEGSDAFELPDCGRCGGPAYKPNLLDPKGPADGPRCRSRTFHPERWTVSKCATCGKTIHRATGATVWEHDRATGAHDPQPVDDGIEVGNVAAAGEIVRVAGQQYGWLTRLRGDDGKRLPPDNPRVAPSHIGIRSEDGVPYFDLEAVREFDKHRPGPGAPGRPRRRAPLVAGAATEHPQAAAS